MAMVGFWLSSAVEAQSPLLVDKRETVEQEKAPTHKFLDLLPMAPT